MQHTLPIDFERRMQHQLGDAYGEFLAALQAEAPMSIRQNPAKLFDVLATLKSTSIPWVQDGYYLTERPVFTLDPAFHAGMYYVQEASSMLISHALRQKINFDKSLKILDLCAAPGGKSTLLAGLMNDKSLLLSNEVIKSRVTILKENLNKWGNPNVMVSNHEIEEMSGLECIFDVILIDAPCSGEGLFRKDAHARDEWSQDNVQLCAARQKKIMANAVHLLREGGTLLYSTCTYNDAENIDNVQWLMDNFAFETQSVEMPSDWGVTTIGKGKAIGYQCFPHLTRGEGFFFSIFTKVKHEFSKQFGQIIHKEKRLESLTKKDIERLQPWLKDSGELIFFRKGNGVIVAVPKAILHASDEINQALQRVSYGIELGEFKGQDFIPSHDLALSTLISSNVPYIELDRQDALRFLKKELHQVDSLQKGWTVARYEGQNLGWMKILPNRINNYLPAHFRIRMDIDN